MKKIFAVLVVIALSSSVFAQNASDQKFHFGLKAAPSLAWLRTDSKGIESDGSTFGFSYGLITEFRLTTNYAFATGVDVTYRGGKFKSSSSSIDTSGVTITQNNESSINLEYIEIPLTLKLKTNPIGDFTYFLQFGVAPGYNIRARQDSKVTTQVGSASPTTIDTTGVDIQKDINSFNLAMIITGGLEFSLSGNTVLLGGITFNNGFLDVLDDSDAKANTNYIALTLGILF